MVILAFGSSTTWGSWDENGGWAERLKNYAFQKAKENNYEDYVNVYNLGVDGDNTERLLKRYEIEIQGTTCDDKDLVIIIAMGSNDSQYLSKENQYWVGPQDFENNLNKLVVVANKYNGKVIFLEPTPVDRRVDSIPWKKEATYTMENRKKYSDIIRKVCQEQNLPFIEILSKFPQGDPNPLLVDGVHPNTRGHEIIFEQVKKYLVESSII